MSRLVRTLCEVLKPSCFNLISSRFNLKPPRFYLKPCRSNLQPPRFNLKGVSLVRCTLFMIDAFCGVSAAKTLEFLGFGEMHLVYD